MIFAGFVCFIYGTQKESESDSVPGTFSGENLRGIQMEHRVEIQMEIY